MTRLIPFIELRHRVLMLLTIACEGAEHDFKCRKFLHGVMRKANKRFNKGEWMTHYRPEDAQTFVANHLMAGMADIQFISMENSEYDSPTPAEPEEDGGVEAPPPPGHPKSPDWN